MKILDIEDLCGTYGEEMTLGGLLRELQGRRVHKCPRCGGEGEILADDDFFRDPKATAIRTGPYMTTARCVAG